MEGFQIILILRIPLSGTLRGPSERQVLLTWYPMVAEVRSAAGICISGTAVIQINVNIVTTLNISSYYDIVSGSRCACSGCCTCLRINIGIKLNTGYVVKAAIFHKVLPEEETILNLFGSLSNLNGGLCNKTLTRPYRNIMII